LLGSGIFKRGVFYINLIISLTFYMLPIRVKDDE